MNIISISNLNKIYKSKKIEKQALFDVNLNIPRGSIFGLLGVNGAGKSTLINILSQLVNKNTGKIIINDVDADKDKELARSQLGIVPQEIILDPFFTIYESLEYYAGYFNVSKKNRRTEEILKALSLWDKKDYDARKLSGGMKRRVLIAKALVHSPKILILDEPTAGVDVELRDDLWRYVRKLNDEGMTILLTTHYLQEAEELCSEIAVINDGKIVRQDKKDKLMKEFSEKSVDIIFTNGKIKESDEATIEKINGGVRIKYNKEKVPFENIMQMIQEVEVQDIITHDASLEDIFRKLVK